MPSNFARYLVTWSTQRESIEISNETARESLERSRAYRKEYEAMSKNNKWDDAHERLAQARKESESAWTQALSTAAIVQDMIDGN